MSKKWLMVAVSILLVVAFLVWLFMASSKSLPGQKQADLGRKHVTVGSLKTAPGDLPTSGDHYEDWVRAGVYETAKDDGYLIHSLEHGYVVMHYQCSEGLGKTQNASESASLISLNEDCKTRRDQLIKIFEKKGKRKLIVVPRPNLDSKLALTAWNYVDKFDSFDQARIERFIDAHRDQGPERTME